MLESLPEEDQRFAFQFFLAQSPQLNAYAMPGGNIVIYTGLIEAAGAPEEVAGVLAHEMAHVTRRHSIRRILSTLGLYVALQVFLGDVEGLLAIIGEQGLYLLTLDYSRSQELEADRVGFEYLRAARIDPSGLHKFFEQLANRESELAIPELLSTHPPTQERMERLQAMLSEVDPNESRPMQLDLDRMKARIRGLPVTQATD